MPEPIPREVRAARTEISRLTTERTRLLRDAARTGTFEEGRLHEIDDRIGGVLDGIVALIDPCDATADAPLVLLPVRLETRFGKRGRQAILRVRIYPDEIHVDDLARGLTDDEASAGRAYWTSIWTDPVPDAAWPTFVESVGADRVEWVAHVMTPTNLAQRGAAATPAFPTPEQRGPRNVVARALPDRFVVLAVQGERVSRAVGRPIPPDLALSPIPLAGDEPARIADSLTIPPGSEWLVDYERAVEVGMAVTVELTGGAEAVDRLIAVGTRASLSPNAGADELEDLLTGHRFGAGFGLLPQGVPTNNSEAERSPYRRRLEPVPPSLTPPLADAASDASSAAAMLGVDAVLMTGLVGAGTGEQRIGKLVNTALWAPGWGEYLSRLDKQGVPGVVDAQRESARRLFRDHVRGRGNAPAIRVGAQPYGVLPVSDLRAWQPRAGETTAGIVNLIRILLDKWLVAANLNVPRIRPGQVGLDDTLLDVLGSSPVMQGLRVRPLLSDDVSGAVIAGLGLDRREYESEKMSMAAVVADLLGPDAPRIVIGSLHRDSRPLPLPLASPRDGEFIAALLGTPSRVLEIDSVLQALLALGWQSNESDVENAAPAAVLPTLVDFVELDPQLKVRATAMVGRAETAAPDELLGMVRQFESAGVTVGGSSALHGFQPLEQIQTSLAEVALSSPATAEARAIGASALAGWFLAMGYRSEVRTAMQELASTDIAARALAVAEALDCSSHRLDAWATAVIADRRSTQVAASRGGRGLTIGAYGVVEDLRSGTGSAVDGWIYGPSTRHAVAAGILRSAHISHLPDADPGDGGPFAIDLSSRRMQSAAKVIEGVRRGQHIGALVGYQIERGLADARLARLQLSLRTIAPLVARRLTDDDGLDSQVAQEAVAAANVVDAILLLKLHPPGDAALRAALDKAPENAYLDPADWEPLTNTQWSAVTRVMREATDTIDAVADVMLTESVLQFANGNPQRAAAAMDAMSTGASPSDTIDILETHDSGERLTHRVLAVVDAHEHASAWNRLRPRAQVEPRLESWAAAHLGDPTDIVVAETAAGRITLDEAGLAALDLVFAADEAAFERNLRVALPRLGDTPLAVKRDTAWPAGRRAIRQVLPLASVLRALIAGSRPILPLDLARPGEKATHEVGAAMPELSARVTSLAASITAAVANLQGQVALIPASGIVDDGATASAIAAAAYRLEPFGIALEPAPTLPLDVSWVRSAWEAAEARSLAVTSLASQLAALPADGPTTIALDLAQDAVGAIFGDGFLVVPLLPPGTGADRFVEAVADPVFAAPPASTLRRFLRDVSTVRPQVTRLSEALLIGDALGLGRVLEVAQLSEREAGGPAAGSTHWLAGPLPPAGPWPASSVAHLVLDRIGTVAADAALGGIVIDAWLEEVPAQPGPKADPADPRPNRARTGLAIRHNSASARPPQAVLCAVSPKGERWTSDSLRGVIEQTLDLARIRMVTLERLAGEALVLPALYTHSSSLQGQKFIHFRELAEQSTTFVSMPFVKEPPQ